MALTQVANPFMPRDLGGANRRQLATYVSCVSVASVVSYVVRGGSLALLCNRFQSASIE